MIPYPSGSLHIGHIRNYTISDTLNRFLKLNKYKIYNYIGWDSFGTPAENISILKNVMPFKWIKNNIFYMKKQLKLINFFKRWKKNYITSNFDYYKITQWIFIQLLKFKMIYIKKSLVNWDPVDNSILSNEQVIDGKGWRSGVDIILKKKETYFINLTYYKKELYNEIKNLNWPKKVKLMQINWIGNKKIIYIKFIFFKKNIYKYYIFLKNIFISLSIILIISFLKKNIFFFKKKYFLINLDKNSIYVNTGLNFKNIFKNKKNELWVIKIRKKNFYIYYKNFKFIFFNLNFFDLFFFLKKKNNYIKIKNFWNIKDWGVSRQRYWGTPIPINLCKKCGFLFNSYKNLPVILPKFLKSLKNINILKLNMFFINSLCFLCKNKSLKEIETLDTFFDSSWYYLNYFNFNKKNKLINKWLPIDFYIGGIEHSILHLLYSRFIIKFLRDIKLLNFGEPAKKLFTIGMILNITYYKINNGVKEWISKEKLENFNFKLGKIEKMSKSKKNGINPNEIIKNYGIDSLRFSVIYFSELNKDFLWNDKYIIKSYNYINNIWEFYFKKKNYIKKNFIFKNNVTCNDKNFLFFFYKNLENINYFYLNINYNKIIHIFILLFNIILNINLKNLLILNEVFSIMLKIISPIIPNLIYKIWNNLLYKNQLGTINNNFWNKIYYINLKKNKYKFLIFINNKKKYIIKYFNKNISYKYIFNYLIFKKKFFNSNIKKIIFNKNIINIIIKNKV